MLFMKHTKVRIEMNQATFPPAARPPLAATAVSLRAKRGTVAAVALLSLLCLALLLPSTASATTFDKEELAFLELINDYRASSGKAELLLSPQLSLSAERHAQDMGKYRYFSHDTQSSDYYPSGYSFWERLEKDGYPMATTGENLAAGPPTAAEAFNLWKNSSGHNANMLQSAFRVIGIARAYVPDSPFGWYWVTDFGDVVDSTAYDPSADLGGPFKDVSPDHVFAPYIEKLKAKGYVGGYSDGRFGVNDSILRAQFAKTIVTAMQKHTPEDEYAGHSSFEDVEPTGSYPHDYVEEAARLGIVTGDAHGYFKPFQRITRAQMALMIVRAAGDQLKSGGTDPGFEDTSGLAPVFKEAIATAKANGILSGYKDGSFKPSASATRGQMAKMVYMLDQLVAQ